MFTTSRWLVLSSLLWLGACGEVTPNSMTDGDGASSVGGKADGEFTVRANGGYTCAEFVQRRDAAMAATTFLGFRSSDEIPNAFDRTFILGFITGFNSLEGDDAFGSETIEDVEARIVTECQADPTRLMASGLLAAIQTYRSGR